MILPTEMVMDLCIAQERHRRLAKGGSPATARGCGELCRALLAAAVAIAAPISDFDEVLSFTCAVGPLQKYLWGTLGAQVNDRKQGPMPQK